MKNPSQEDLFILFRDNKALQHLYDKLLPSIERYILKNSGNSYDAKDVFQEAIIIVYRKVQDADFQITSSLETFIFSIAKRKWLRELKKRKRDIHNLRIADSSEGNKIDQMVINHEKSNLYLRYFNDLSDSCKEILNLFFDGWKIPEITKKLNFGSDGYTRKRKHNCQQKLVNSIKQDRLFKELKNE